ncbi:MAG: restriction endonuclease subunit S [Snowella sp.]
MDRKQLPEVWELKSIGEVCKTGAGGTPLKSNKEYYEGGEIPWLLSGEVAQGEIFKSENFITQVGLENSSAKIFPKNTVLVAMYGATAGQVGILRFEAATNQAVCGILPNKNFVPEFIYYALLSKKEELISKAQGNAQPNISQLKIKETKIPVPPIDEQKRIVAILDEAFEGIDQAIRNTEKNLANARELFDSYLNKIFTYKGNEWEEKVLGQEINLQTGFAFKSKNYTDSCDDIQLLRGDNIMQGFLRWDDVKRWPKSDRQQYKNYEIDEKDIVLAMDRPWVKAGLKHAQIQKQDLPCLLVQRVARLRAKSELNDRFLFYLVGSSTFSKYLLDNQTGIGVPHISGKQIQNFRFSRPSLEEQYFIIKKLDNLKIETQRLEAIYRQKLASLNELKQSILQKAFTGQLTRKSC